MCRSLQLIRRKDLKMEKYTFAVLILIHNAKFIFLYLKNNKCYFLLLTT